MTSASRSISLSIWLVLSSLFVAGCGDDGLPSQDGGLQLPDAGRSDAAAHDGGSAGTDAGNAGTDAAAGSDGGHGASDAGSGADAGAGADAGPAMGTACGATTCSATQFCDDSANHCGDATSTLTCMPSPDICPDIYLPVCGCDGVVHANECDAQSAGVDLDGLGGCTPPEGMFPCGARFCSLGNQYCRVSLSDIAGTPDVSACAEIPAACEGTSTDSCTCLASEPCGTSCAVDVFGGRTVTCPGG